MMNFLIKLLDSFAKIFKVTTPVVQAEAAQVNNVFELKAEAGKVEVKTKPAKKAPAKKAPKSPAKKAPKSPAKAEVAEKRTSKKSAVKEAPKDDKAPTKKTAKKKPSLKVEK